MMETKNYYSVSQVNEYIKSIFDTIEPLRNITIRGEISNCRGRNKSGHIYFSLKDENCIINAVIFKFEAFKLNFEPKNGDDVIATGSISSYPPNGTYQLIIKDISLFGKGELLLKKEELKKKLFNEGLFDAAHKKTIPLYPMNIAIITGKNSAASRDFEFNILRRFPLCKIQNFFSLVQGIEAPTDLIKNLKAAEKTEPDLIIIGRGGGSSDDLSAFDDENLVRALYNCSIPTISAVGHEIDLSFCDLVCDLHVSTPTGAAEAAVPDVEQLLTDLSQTDQYIKSIINRKISDQEKKLNQLKSSKYFTNINLIFDSYIQKLNEYSKFIKLKVANNIDKNLSNIKSLTNQLSLANPKNILEKGYSITTNERGKIIKSVHDIRIGETLRINVADGTIKSDVKEVEKK